MSQTTSTRKNADSVRTRRLETLAVNDARTQNQELNVDRLKLRKGLEVENKSPLSAIRILTGEWTKIKNLWDPTLHCCNGVSSNCPPDVDHTVEDDDEDDWEMLE